jgi:hypothetical protein
VQGGHNVGVDLGHDENNAPEMRPSFGITPFGGHGRPAVARFLGL